MGLMDNSVKNCICDCRISEQVVPLVLRILAGDQERPVLRLLIDNLKQKRPQLSIYSTDTQIINNQKLCTDQLTPQLRYRVISVRQ